MRLPARAQDAGRARLHGEGRGVGRHVRAALIDYRDDAHGHGRALYDEAVRPLDMREHAPDRVRQGSDLAYALCHALNALAAEREAVEHDLADAPAGCVHVGGVGREDAVRALDERVRHGEEGSVFRLGVRGRDGALGRGGVQDDVTRALHAFSSL